MYAHMHSNVGHFQDHTFFVVVRSIDYFYIVEVECVILVPCMFGESGPFFRGVVHIFFVFLDSGF